jgi:hypothetical protein
VLDSYTSRAFELIESKTLRHAGAAPALAVWKTVDDFYLSGFAGGVSSL